MKKNFDLQMKKLPVLTENSSSGQVFPLFCTRYFIKSC